jgi:hypothetical protein
MRADRSRKTKVGSPKPEVGSPKPEAGRRKPEDGNWKLIKIGSKSQKVQVSRSKGEVLKLKNLISEFIPES